MLKAEIKRGTVRSTNNQRKKHYTQFTKKELELIEQRLSQLNFNVIVGSIHLQTKKAITYNVEDVRNVINNHDVIEYNLTKKRGMYQKRVLLKGKDVVETDQGKANLCIVVNLKTAEIVTAYYNIIGDDHRTINWDRYDSSLKIIL